jgi:hypothetical protein
MKKIVSILVLLMLCIAWVFAYTPSDDLVERMDNVVEIFEDIIDTKGESYKVAVLSSLENYKVSYSDNERVTYILDYLYTNLEDYEVSSESIATVSNDYTGEYTISDSIYWTEVEVTIANGVRSITSNALPNHEIGEFPNEANPNTMSEQDKSWELTTTPQYVGGQEWARENGIVYNGLKLELETNERVTCESGETYRIEGFETFFNVMGIDFNNAHVQPTGEYHYHGVPLWAVDILEWDDIVHVGYASDGFPIYYSKLGTYSTSFKLKDEERVGTSCTYEARTTTDVTIEGTSPDGTYDIDWEFVGGLGDLDYCNGTYIDGEYGYFVTNEFPYGPRCMNGEYSMWGGGQWGGGWAAPAGWAWERPAR